MKGRDKEMNRISSAQRQSLVAGVDYGVGLDYHGTAPYIAEDEEAVTDAFLDLVYARKHHLPLVLFETERLIVREMTLEDLPQLYEIYAGEGITDYIEPLYAYAEEEAFTRAYIEHMYGFYGYGLWLVFLRDGTLIGRAGLENREINGENQVELGYVIGKEFQRQGYAYECCRAILRYAFAEDELDLAQVILCTSPDNTASAALANKLGFRRLMEASEETHGLDIYSILNQRHNG